MMKSATKTPNTITKAINEFVETASKKFPEIESIVVFGSVARGTYNKDSDIDLLVVVRDHKIQKYLDSLAFDMTLKYGEVFGLIVRTPEEIKYLIKLGTPLMDAVLTEGKIKYGTETFKRTCGKGIGIGAGIPA
ncbi:hypothetical protein BEH94_04670 [Candidatus Altiarchaeales archaeon WOR_SM1_SCG]|nr:hypothetical protein BEH94_04670 [Candidatus Altiarchaeales archaeon WOR_SM1_SCG]